MESEDINFIMLKTNITNVQNSLDNIRKRREKFICLNDNMDHKNPETSKVMPLQFIFKLRFLKS